jgi:hypothetical protein
VQKEGFTGCARGNGVLQPSLTERRGEVGEGGVARYLYTSSTRYEIAESMMVVWVRDDDID